MTTEELLSELIEFRNEHNDHWPEGLISVEISDKIKLEFELNIQSESFFKNESEVFYANSFGGYIATFRAFKVYLIKV
jgi:hypothetical protein